MERGGEAREGEREGGGDKEREIERGVGRGGGRSERIIYLVRHFL